MADSPEHIEKRNQVISAFSSLGIHVVIILLVLSWKLSTPIPPYPEGGGGMGSGIEVNLGNSETGLGNLQSEALPEPVKEEPAVAKAAPAQPEKILTQEVEDEDAIEATRHKEAKKPKPVAVTPVPVIKKPVPVVAEKPVEKKPVVNQNALYKPRTYSQGITSGSGDQGSPSGSPKAVTYTGQGKGGSGGDGSGGGTGGGIGTGNGKGIGSGTPRYDLEGRMPLSLKIPEYHSQVEGVVVVEIVVDKDGKVTSASPGFKGSTTLDETLLQLAKQAALNSRFDKKPDAQAFQKGTITYKFRLQ